MINIAPDIWEDIVNFIRGIRDKIVDFVNWILWSADRIISTIRDYLYGIWDTIHNKLRDLVYWIKEKLGWIWNAIVNGFNAVTSFLSNIANTIWNTISNLASTIYNAVSNAVVNFYNWIRGHLDNIVSAIKNLVNIDS